MHAKAVMDDTGCISIILYVGGEYNRPVAILHVYEWAQINARLTEEIKTLEQQKLTLKLDHA